MDDSEDVADAEQCGGVWLDFLWLQITNFCNLACEHCYASSGPANPLTGTMGFDDWCRLMIDARYLGCRQLQFIGGEPTLHPRLLDLIGYASHLSYDFIEVYTNGIRFTPEQRSMFLERRVALAFSIYGPSAGMHDSVTRRPGSFVKTIENISWAAAAGLKVRCGIIMMPDNEGCVDETEAFLHELGVLHIKSDTVRGIGRGAGLRPHRSDGLASLDELCGECRKGKLCVLPSGVVTPCPLAHFCNVGHHEDGLEAILMGSRLAEFRTAQRSREAIPLQAQICRPADCSPCLPHACAPDKGCVPNWRGEPAIGTGLHQAETSPLNL